MRGYTNYWVAYPLAFQSEESLIFTPWRPYHQGLRYTTRDDRYPYYPQIVRESDSIAYITTHNPVLDDYLRKKFHGLKVTWSECKIGDYQIYYRLSRLIHPEEIGLGINQVQYNK